MSHPGVMDRFMPFDSPTQLLGRMLLTFAVAHYQLQLHLDVNNLAIVCNFNF